MADGSRIQEIVEQVLDSDQAPEDLCRGDDDLLLAVRQRLKQFRTLSDQLKVLFPDDSTGPMPIFFSQQNHSAEVVGVAGQKLGDYRILREIGRGGMGIVYEAIQESLRRHVALKVLSRETADAVRLERFRREARSAALLHHTSIVPVFEVGEHDGVHFYAMQFIRGQSLHQVLAEGGPAKRAVKPLAADEQHRSNSPTQTADYRRAAEIGALLAEALTYAHGQKILHRDIKPGNILLAADGGVWICDFGLAKTEDEDLTHSGELVGTFRYMAPERLSGVSDARSDIYSLGLTLYEMLTLKPAFDESDRGRLIRQIAEHEPIRPSLLDPRVPRDLETIVLKAIAKEPANRYQTAQDFAADLRRFLSDRPIRARRTSTLEQIRRWGRRNPAAAAFAGLAFSALSALAIISTISAIGFRTQRNELEASNDHLKQAERDARLELGKSLLAQGAANLRTDLAGRRDESLKLFRQANEIFQTTPGGQAYLPEMRDQVICARGLVDLHVLWERPYQPAWDISVDSTFQRYAVGDSRKPQIVVRSVNDGREIMTLPGPDVPYWHCWSEFSPDGVYLAIDYHLRNERQSIREVWRLGTQERVLSVRTPNATCAFHPDGRQLLVGSGHKQLTIWDLNDRTAKRRIPLTFEPHHFILDASGKRIALTANHVDREDRPQPRQLQILDFESGAEISSWRAEVGNANLGWSGDGRFLASGSTNGDVFVRDLAGGNPVTVLHGHTGLTSRCQFTRRGYLIGTTTYDDTTRLWDAVTGDCLSVASGKMIGITPDDQSLIFDRRQNVGIWELNKSPEMTLLNSAFVSPQVNSEQRTGYIESADFSPDGKLLAVGSRGGAQVFDADTGEIVAPLDAPACGSVLFDELGKHLLTYDETSLRRWPILRGSAGACAVGPPQKLHETKPGGFRVARWLPGQKALAVFDAAESMVRILAIHDDKNLAEEIAMMPSRFRRPMSMSISRDGQWLATGGWKDDGIQVWNLSAGKFERLLSPSAGAGDPKFWVEFAPDGRLISASRTDDGIGYYAFMHGTWKRELLLDTPNALYCRAPKFTPDGSLMAMAISRTQIRMAEAVTGRVLAHFTALDHSDAIPMAFSPDGARLALCTNRGTMQIWDLRKLRQQLAEWNLDWRQSPPPALTR